MQGQHHTVGAGGHAGSLPSHDSRPRSGERGDTRCGASGVSVHCREALASSWPGGGQAPHSALALALLKTSRLSPSLKAAAKSVYPLWQKKQKDGGEHCRVRGCEHGRKSLPGRGPLCPAVTGEQGLSPTRAHIRFLRAPAWGWRGCGGGLVRPAACSHSKKGPGLLSLQGYWQ